MQKTLISITQWIILLSIRLFYIGRVRVTSDKNALKLKKPMVIAANHANSLDPFIVGCFLPLRMIFKVTPYAFMTANIFYYRPWRPLAFMAGCYPAKPKSELSDTSTYGIGRSVGLLKDNYTVVMFPEGRRTRQRIAAKPGISRILNGQDANLLLCHIQWSSGHPKRVTLSIAAADRQLDRSNPDAVMDAIYRLKPRQTSRSVQPSKHPEAESVG